MLIPTTITVYYLGYLVEIPKRLISDVKLLFLLIFINFLLSTAFSSWKIATFVTNKIYLQSIRTMSSQILRVIVILGLLLLLKPSVASVGIGTLVGAIYITGYSLYYKIKLLPKSK